MVIYQTFLLITLGFLLTSCAHEISQSETIKVGAIYARSGPASSYGTYAINGLMIAQEEINEIGGINGRQLELIFEDSQSRTQSSVNAMQKLINIDEVSAVLSMQSGVVVALSSIANENNIILIDTGSTTPTYTTPDDFTYRTSYSAEHFAKGLSNYLNKQDYKIVGVLVINNDYGKGMAAKYKESITSEVMVETFSEGATDFKTQFNKFLSEDVEAIIYVSHVNEAGLLLRQKEELGLNKQFYTDIYGIEYPLIMELAEEGTEGVIYVAPKYDLTSVDKKFSSFNTKYVAKHDEQSNALAAQTYDGLMVLAESMSKCDDPSDTSCVRSELNKITSFSGVIGDITFDINGEIVNRPLTLKQVRDGEWLFFQE